MAKVTVRIRPGGETVRIEGEELASKAFRANLEKVGEEVERHRGVEHARIKEDTHEHELQF